MTIDVIVLVSPNFRCTCALCITRTGSAMMDVHVVWCVCEMVELSCRRFCVPFRTRDHPWTSIDNWRHRSMWWLVVRTSCI